MHKRKSSKYFQSINTNLSYRKKIIKRQYQIEYTDDDDDGKRCL